MPTLTLQIPVPHVHRTQTEESTVHASRYPSTKQSLIARFMGPIWGPSGADMTQVGPMLAPWTLLSWVVVSHSVGTVKITKVSVIYFIFFGYWIQMCFSYFPDLTKLFKSSDKKNSYRYIPFTKGLWAHNPDLVKICVANTWKTSRKLSWFIYIGMLRNTLEYIKNCRQNVSNLLWL